MRTRNDLLKTLENSRHFNSHLIPQTLLPFTRRDFLLIKNWLSTFASVWLLAWPENNNERNILQSCLKLFTGQTGVLYSYFHFFFAFYWFSFILMLMVLQQIRIWSSCWSTVRRSSVDEAGLQRWRSWMHMVNAWESSWGTTSSTGLHDIAWCQSTNRPTWQ